MNKKVLAALVTLLFISVCCVAGFALLGGDKSEKEQSTIDNTPNSSVKNDDDEVKDDGGRDENSTGSAKKVLVVYFSATNNTKTVAEKIAENLNGDTFEIVPVEEYTSEDLNYGNPDSRVSKEHDDEALRNVELETTKVDNWDSYDTVLIGYPIWWQVAAWPVDSFVKANNFDGKTVIPFCTSTSSNLGQSGKLLESEANGGNWLDGHRFSSRPSDSDIKAFTDGIK